MGKYLKPEIIVSVAAAGLALGLIAAYGKQIPVIGAQVAELAKAAK